MNPHQDSGAPSGLSINMQLGESDRYVEWVRRVMRQIPDPRAQLSPTGLRVLDGAWQVTLQSGFGKLTLSRISKASTENIAAVKYYFGNKAGLVRVLLDAVIYDMVSGFVAALEQAPPDGPAARLTVETKMLNEPSEASRIFIDVLAEALRDEGLLERVRSFNQIFFDLHLEQLRSTYGLDPAKHSHARGLASLLSVIGDGLVVLSLIAPDFFDTDEVIAVLAVLFEHGLPFLAQSAASDLSRPASLETQ
jgi:AcrR family transcriptional regulator